MIFVSYAQNLEDVMLWRALKHIESGFYVDVGANDPKNLSVTYAFYQRGWHGINMDPATYLLLSQERTRDINLEVAAGETNGDVHFYELSNSALSTSDSQLANDYRKTGQTIIERKVKSWTLNHVLEMYADGPIHFMNIDVEGAELQVLKGLDLSLWRPWIILIEATIPTTRTPAFEEWEPLIVSSNYEFVYFDGLNRYYVAKEHGELMNAFQTPPNIFDQYMLSSQVDNLRELDAKEKVIQTQKIELEARERLIRLQEGLLNKEKIINDLQEKLLGKEKIISDLEDALVEKEKVIHDFRTYYVYWFLNGPFRWFPKLREIVYRFQRFRRLFLPQVGVLAQYLPRPLFIPPSYGNIQDTTPNQNLPRISIVTPSYNQGEFIGRTVESVLSQDYPSLEYVIQDGNSKDNTLDVLRSFQEKLAHFDSRQDNGQAHAINIGFQHTSGEIMAYLNSDDILLPGALSYVAAYFTHHPDVDVVYSHRVIINDLDQEIGRWILPPHDNEILLWADYIPQETLFWRRSLWEKIGSQMNESFHFALDWDLILRFRAVGAKFRRLPRFLAAFRLQAGQKTSIQMSSVGLNEMDRLRRQFHGHDVTWHEINKNIAPYLRRSLVFHRLYRLGILRY